MPTVLRHGPYRLFFFSADCDEPAHMHVQRERCIAKVWLHDARVAGTGTYPPGEIGRIVAIVRENRAVLRDRWDEHCGR